MDKLISVARGRGLERIYGEVLSTNRNMLNFCRKLGFAPARELVREFIQKKTELLAEPQALLVIDEQLTMGELVAFTAYMAQLISPVRYLGMILPAISMAGASAERVFEILDTIPDVSEALDAQPLKVQKGYVRFEQVAFSYGKQAMRSIAGEVLKDISFRVGKGDIGLGER